MKFSIITCTYNSAAFLQKNIQSVQDQTYNDFEHIFVDSYSQDGTVELLTSYQKQYPDKVKIIQTPPAGISNAMNEGIRQASGDYLIHLHSDDSFYDNEVLFDVNNFLNINEVDWIYGQINVVKENGDIIGSWPKRKIFQNTSHSIFGRYFLKFFTFVPHQAVFIKKDVFQRFGYFDETISTGMDADLWLRIYNKTNWAFFNRVISNYCVRFGAASSGLANRAKIQKNRKLVQKRYLNPAEFYLAVSLNHILDKLKSNYY